MMSLWYGVDFLMYMLLCLREGFMLCDASLLQNVDILKDENLSWPFQFTEHVLMFWQNMELYLLFFSEIGCIGT